MTERPGERRCAEHLLAGEQHITPAVEVKRAKRKAGCDNPK